MSEKKTTDEHLAQVPYALLDDLVSNTKRLMASVYLYQRDPRKEYRQMYKSMQDEVREAEKILESNNDANPFE